LFSLPQQSRTFKSSKESTSSKAKAMSNFKFQPKDSPETSIDKFFEHLKARDADMAKILIANLNRIHPLPESAAQRSASRRAFSQKVLADLQKLRTRGEGERR
jgi:hypothetical protein